MSDDVLSWLLPEADAVERRRVRSLVTALRLLRDDARRPDARRVAPSWRRARSELERLERLERRRALESLLGAHLAALRPGDSFLELPAGPPAYDDAWRALLFAPRVPGFPPPPGASAREVVARLLEAGSPLGAHAAWRELGEASLRHVGGPLAEARRNWEARLAARVASGAPPAQLARLLAGALAARLDLGAPARAAELAARHARLLEGDAPLRRLAGWSLLLRGDAARARELLRGTGAARLPAALAELRADEPLWAEVLSGTPDDSATSPVPTQVTLARRAFGALALGLFVARAPGGAEVLALDVDEGLGALAVPPAPVFGASGVLRRRRLEASAACLAGALGGARTRAMVQLALRGADEAPRGWVQVECAHLLLPATARVQALARAWEPALRARVELGPAPGGGLEFEPLARADPRREFVARAFAGLGALRDGRASWLEPGPAGRWLVRAEAGRGLPDERARAGGGGILHRAAAGLAAEHAGEPAQSLRVGAAFGLALPLCARHGARVLGVLVLEFARRPAAAPFAGLDERLRELEPLWWACAFRARRLALGGGDFAWEPGCRFLTGLAPALASAVAARRALLLHGPPGSGRRTLAHWLRFRRAGPVAEAERDLLELATLDGAAQASLARELEAGRAHLGFLLAEAPLAELCSGARLVPALARQLEPLALRVPPLCERRDEIPALVRAFAGERAAARAPLVFEDEALAELWRQPWPGQVRELGALVRQLALAHAASVSAAEVRAALRSRGLPVCARLPSRRPSALALELALATTRHRNGGWNRARAARYLGWDVATLEARLKERAEP